jgi:hypothetical protein
MPYPRMHLTVETQTRSRLPNAWTRKNNSPMPPCPRRRRHQGAPAPSSPEAQREEALSFVRGWAWGIEDAIRASPPDTLSRSRVRDRCGSALRGRLPLTQPLLGTGHGFDVCMRSASSLHALLWVHCCAQPALLPCSSNQDRKAVLHAIHPPTPLPPLCGRLRPRPAAAGPQAALDAAS